MLSCEQKLAYSLLCCTNQTPDSNLIQLWIFIHHNYAFIHLITIVIQNNFLCVIQFQLLYVHFSLHYSIQTATVMQWNKQLARCQHVTRPCNFLSKMFLTPKWIKNFPIPTLVQIHAWNIDKAALIMTQVGKKYGVMKSSIWIIFHQSNSG